MCQGDIPGLEKSKCGACPGVISGERHEVGLVANAD
jgi:hypothetical protein